MNALMAISPPIASLDNAAATRSSAVYRLTCVVILRRIRIRPAIATWRISQPGIRAALPDSALPHLAQRSQLQGALAILDVAPQSPQLPEHPDGLPMRSPDRRN